MVADFDTFELAQIHVAARNTAMFALQWKEAK
jgi:hypothetical protein